MFDLSLDLKVTIGKKGYTPAMDDSRKLFKSIFDDSQSKGVASRVTATECDSTLNDIVRPTIQEAAEEIKLEKVRFNQSNHEPFILVIGSHEPFDEIRFMCQGNELLIRVQIVGQDITIDSYALSDVSKKLVANNIDRFLRKSLRLPGKRDFA